jgi:hypothetical protein
MNRTAPIAAALAELRHHPADRPLVLDAAVEILRALADELPEAHRLDLPRHVARAYELAPWQALGLLAAYAENNARFVPGLSKETRASFAELAEMTAAAGRVQRPAGALAQLPAEGASR